MELERPCFFFCLCLFFFGESWSESDVPVVCGGFIKSSFPVDFSQVKVNIYSIDGMLKYSTDCAPNNGYFLFPLYDQGEYLVKAVPPHGWMIAPNEVPLVVKDTKISCNSGRDIFFQLIGFTLEGQVTSGDILPGPEGVEVSLLPSEGANEEAEIRHVYTVVEGRFKIEGVSPGVYHVSAHHPLWKMSQDSIQVVVVDTPVIAPAGLKVLGFDVKGAVESGGEPVNGVFLFLFATQQLEGSRKEMVCSLNEASPPPSPKDTKAHVCAVMSDSSGHFIFYPLPPGTYSVVPVYRLKDLHFEVHPVEVHFTVSNDSVTLPHHFEVQGFTVTGQVVLTREGPPVVGARVMLGDHHGAITDENGRYQLLNVTTGSYILKVEGQDMQFDLKEVHISPTNPSLLPVSPNKYLVCGDVVETIPVATSRKGKSRKIQVLSTFTKSVVIATSNTQEDGNFCVYLPLGEYRVKVVVSSEEGEKGMMILPVEQFVAMQDTPIASRIIFTQFLASLSGSVICIENCPETLDIQLHRSQEGTQDLSARVKVNGTRAHFNFTDVLPGGVKVILNYVGWCWEMSELAIVVIKGSQTPLLFSHTGYSLNYEVSHDTLIKYSRGNNFSEEAVLMAKGSLCLKEPGVYRIVPQSCHEFEKDVYIFDTSSPIDLVLHSTGHSLHIPVRTQVEDSSLIVVITSSGSEKKLKPDKVEKLSEGEWMYSFSAIVRVSLEVIIQPRASVLMFSPASLVWTVGQGCPETVTTFLGSPGELIEGKVEPSLANVTVVVDLGSEGQVTTYTDVSGYYRAGPVRGGDHITVSVVHEGYIFEPLDDKYSFKAIKLCDVTVQVTIGDGDPLAGALVSISGEDFRQNSFTDDSGVLSYYELAPGQYFLKPFLREFDFTPSSLILNLSEGSNKAAVFIGRRVAFSCSGVVSTLNRRQFASVGIQASGIVEGEKCFSYSETTTTDSDGMYRLHGLIPGCQYNVSVKDLGNEPSNSLPSFRTLVIEESDVDGVDFLLVSQMKWIYISGWVDTDPKFVGTLKVGVSAEGKTEESPLYSVAVDAVGFFDFPPLSPLLNGNYILSLQSSLSTHSYKFASVEKVVAGADDSHVLLNFAAEEVHVDKESQSKGSVVALILVVALAFAVLNFDKVLMQIRSYTHSLTSSSNGSDKRKLSQRGIKK